MKASSAEATSKTPASIVRFATLMAFTTSTTLAFTPPLLFYYFGANYEQGLTEAEAKIHSRTVSQLIGRNPTMWQFETLRINEFIENTEPGNQITVLDSVGQTVVESRPEKVASPSVSVTLPLFDAGHPVGELVVTHSLRDVAIGTLMVFFVTGLVSFGAFFILRTFPLKLLRRAHEQALFLASHDPLTKLPNRSLFNDSLSHSIVDVDRHGTSMAVLCLDLDHFKEVNDILGHAAGDNLLCQASARMTETLRSNDMLARLGGDEFAIVQRNIGSPLESSVLAQRLIETLSAPFDLDGNEVLIGVSIGISTRNPGDDTNGEILLQHSDMALYGAKNNGRGTFRHFEQEMNDALIARKKVEVGLRRAISENELELHYQPQVDLQTNTIKGVEALLRWNHKTDGLISPDQFIPLAEECGLIVSIGDWVIREACRQAKDWPGLTFAVNVSPIQFRQGNLVKTIRDALEAENVDPKRLEIEITEGVLLSHTEETISILKELQELGIKIAMDDFGTGYSSLSYLRRFPFDKIKIDRSFTTDLGTCIAADSIIEAVIKLGASMGMTSNAEGVETIEQANLLRDQGCKEVQGFHFSKPMPSASICELLADWEWDTFQKDNEQYYVLNPAETLKG
jgi:diguanylate cyclase (GGDEF)-like protein